MTIAASVSSGTHPFHKAPSKATIQLMVTTLIWQAAARIDGSPNVIALRSGSPVDGIE